MLAELLRDPLPTRMRRQLAGDDSRLPMLVDRTLPCTVDVISIGCLKVTVHYELAFGGVNSRMSGNGVGGRGCRVVSTVWCGVMCRGNLVVLRGLVNLRCFSCVPVFLDGCRHLRRCPLGSYVYFPSSGIVAHLYATPPARAKQASIGICACAVKIHAGVVDWTNASVGGLQAAIPNLVAGKTAVCSRLLFALRGRS